MSQHHHHHHHHHHHYQHYQHYHRHHHHCGGPCRTLLNWDAEGLAIQPHADVVSARQAQPALKQFLTCDLESFSLATRKIFTSTVATFRVNVLGAWGEKFCFGNQVSLHNVIHVIQLHAHSAFTLSGTSINTGPLA